MHPYKMIIADDEPLIRNGLKNNIDWAALNFTVVGVFPCGNDVIRFLQENSVDVVLTDVRMTDGGGLDVAEWINAHRPNMQVVLLTGYTDYDVARNAINLDVVCHLSNKPLFLPELKGVFAALAEKLDRRSSQQKAQLSMNMKCLQQLLDGAKDAERLWNDMGLCALEIELPAGVSADEAPALQAEQLSQEFTGMAIHDGDACVCLYPCRRECAQTLCEVARQAIQERPLFQNAAMRLHSTGQALQVRLSALSSECGSQRNRLLQDVDEYLQARVSEKITLQQAAKWLHYSPSHFSRKFKEQAGVGFAAYVLNDKLRHAMRLLRTTDRSISEIASAVSFDNTHHFAQVFKKRVGATPSAYRRHPPKED